MNCIKDYNRIVASRDYETGTLKIRIDYMADKDALSFYIDGDKTFTISKKILHKSNHGTTYTIVVENEGTSHIDTPIMLYSDNDGVFTTQKIFQRNIVGREVNITSMKPGQKTRFMFLIRKISDREEALRLIKELTEDTIYGKKILSIFERFDEELRDDKELFMEGLQHNPHVMNYASEELHKDLDLQKLYTSKVTGIE
jgi:hypothetical protein